MPRCYHAGRQPLASAGRHDPREGIGIGMGLHRESNHEPSVYFHQDGSRGILHVGISSFLPAGSGPDSGRPRLRLRATTAGATLFSPCSRFPVSGVAAFTLPFLLEGHLVSNLPPYGTSPYRTAAALRTQCNLQGSKAASRKILHVRFSNHY
ncbi:hypothetical protein BO71DRAFT_189106 [Aspergillus ellipticus CBS 707.79]|uniref:Uncharacterized protein n=1 Tax=Aspergillus ellipticus CBS 707.79 TaxID=1448320 RepID=A0A319DF26_9EURO|nr:hypothetical protein BO71DRAFT_189106 [Aspergillus ellipticus CBS 707.79]